MADLPERLLEGLKHRYGEAHRRYHDWSHIEALLALFSDLADKLDDPLAVWAAIYYHDAIYDPQSTGNEADSAALLREECGGLLPPETLERAVAMIEATAGHRLPEAFSGEDAAYFLDMDLSILGAEPAAFDTYEAQIRAEYVHVPEALFCAGRAEILANFLARETLYFTSYFAERLEDRARNNLRRSLDRLR